MGGIFGGIDGSCTRDDSSTESCVTATPRSPYLYFLIMIVHQMMTIMAQKYQIFNVVVFSIFI